ncbi:MAG TPA: hypothetical protein PLD27_05230 [bacterium]|nr:hypothetical protein [bacterium]HOL47681.1 hypothetical protein [bacterium]HPQ18705.1 hypothetical protein [bacterium]
MKKKYKKPLLKKYEKIENIIKADWTGEPARSVSEGFLGTFSNADCDAGKTDPINTDYCLYEFDAGGD